MAGNPAEKHETSLKFIHIVWGPVFTKMKINV